MSFFSGLNYAKKVVIKKSDRSPKGRNKKIITSLTTFYPITSFLFRPFGDRSIFYYDLFTSFCLGASIFYYDFVPIDFLLRLFHEFLLRPFGDRSSFYYDLLVTDRVFITTFFSKKVVIKKSKKVVIKNRSVTKRS